MKTDDFDQTLRNALSGTAPADVHEGAQSHFDDLAARLQSQPVQSRCGSVIPFGGFGRDSASSAPRPSCCSPPASFSRPR